MHAEPASRLLVDLRIVEHRVDPLAAAALEHAAGLRAAERELHPGDAVRALALGGGDSQPVALRERDQDELRLDELLQAARDEGEERLELELRDERVADLVQRLELPQPARRALVQPRVLDRDGGLRGEQLRQLLVLVGEVEAAGLLGQVEVAVRDAAEDDRQAEERLHRRVVRWKAHRTRVVRDFVQPQRLRVADQDAEDAAAVRKVADRRVRLGVDPRRQEPLERLAGLVDHAEGRVARAGDLRGRLDDALQQRIERELGAERDPRVRRGRGAGRAGAPRWSRGHSRPTADRRARNACYRGHGRGAWRSLVSALVWGTRGPEFESRRPD